MIQYETKPSRCKKFTKHKDSEETFTLLGYSSGILCCMATNAPGTKFMMKRLHVPIIPLAKKIRRKETKSPESVESSGW